MKIDNARGGWNLSLFRNPIVFLIAMGATTAAAQQRPAPQDLGMLNGAHTATNSDLQLDDVMVRPELRPETSKPQIIKGASTADMPTSEMAGCPRCWERLPVEQGAAKMLPERLRPENGIIQYVEAIQRE